MAYDSALHTEGHGHAVPGAGRGVGRRTLLLGSAAGLATVAFGTLGSSAAHAATSPIPKLPGEVSRKTNQVTSQGKKLYEDILVSINGDPARIMVPWTAVPKSTTKIGVVWFYHATGSDHNSLDYVYKYTSELCVDQGAVTICQKAGGDTYSNPTAQQHQKNGYAYLSSVFSIGVNFLRSNSGGGALACSTYGQKLIPGIRGMYLASSVYDMEKLYASAPTMIGPSYGNNVALIASTNPARIAASKWKGANVRIAVAADSNPDPVVPAKDHGGALIATIQGYATENSARYYTTGGHDVPSWTATDMLSAFQRWL